MPGRWMCLDVGDPDEGSLGIHRDTWVIRSYLVLLRCVLLTLAQELYVSCIFGVRRFEIGTNQYIGSVAL